MSTVTLTHAGFGKLNSFCVFCLMSAFLFYCSLPCEGGTWRDSFNDGNANGWTLFSALPAASESLDGVLEFHVFANPHPLANHFLEWTAVPFEAESLTVQATFPIQNRNDFGIAFGKHSSHEIFGPLTECYAFLRANRVFGIAIIQAIAGGASGRAGKAPRDQFGDTIEEIKIVFNSGRFRMFSGGKLMVDFTDRDFPTIDAVGIFARTSKGVEFWGKIDDFVISGPSIPDGNGRLAVKPRGKLSTTWGYLKKTDR